PVRLDLKIPGVQSIASEWFGNAILDTDGKLWWFGEQPRNALGNNPYYALKISEEKWSAVAINSWQNIAAIKADGSLWYQHADRFSGSYPFAPLERLGQRTDWIAICTLS